MSRYEELESIEAWQAAPSDARERIAKEIAKASGLELEVVAPFRRADLPLASYGGMDRLFRFVLVPGGDFEMGLSDAEVAVLQALAKPFALEPTYEASWGSLLAATSAMRPTHRARVGPVLFAQNTVGGFTTDDWRREVGNFLVGDAGDTSTLPPDLEAGLAQFGWRLPTEAEWEWCARGGRTGEITFQGNEQPDATYLRRIKREMEASEATDAEDRHAGISNDFGLLGFGVDAELCRDLFVPEPGAPFETTPDLALRAVRGGASTIAPWRNPGDWQALLTAYRQRCRGLRFDIAVRFVRDI